MIRYMEKLAQWLLIAATCCGIGLTVFVALSAIMRYVVRAPFAFTEELVGLLFSALVFLALPYVTLKRRHIQVTIFTDLFPARLRRITDLISDLLVVLFCVWFGKYAYDFARFSYDLGSRTDLAGIILWPWMAAMVLASLLMGVFSVLLIMRCTSD